MNHWELSFLELSVLQSGILKCHGVVAHAAIEISHVSDFLLTYIYIYMGIHVDTFVFPLGAPYNERRSMRQGDRPDQKFTPWIASLASPDLMES